MDYNFDRVADKYDATRGFPPGVAERVCRWVLSRLPADPTIAEIGVGTGRIAIPFVESGVRYTGFDISEQMLARLKQKLGGALRRANLHVADITQPLPVPEATQDAVIAVHILHLVDALAALQQVKQILRPHGALVWGYNMHDDLTPKRSIRPKFYEIVSELGGPPRRDFFAQPAREQLAQWGARVTQHVVAAWTDSESPRNVLDGLRDRVMSSTWDIQDDLLQEAARRTEAWALYQYGDLDRAFDYEARFVVDWYQF